MMLESIRYVDLVIPEDGWGQKKLMLNVSMSMFSLWDMTGRRI